jgi:hypothetical protein
MEQVPVARIVTVLPDTVQTEGVFEAKVTANPEVALALMVKEATPSVTLLRAPNVMLWEAGFETEKDCVTRTAAAKVELPA